MALAAYNFRIVNAAGALTGGHLEVRSEATGQLATLYANRNGSETLDNPFHAPTGKGVIYVPGVLGGYRIKGLVPGFEDELFHVAIGLAAETDISLATPMGDWDIDLVYQTGHYVQHGGRTFVSRVDDNQENEPPDSEDSDEFWMYAPAALGPPGANFTPDAVVALIAGRDSYDDEQAAFSLLVMSDSGNDNKRTLYFKLSGATADWSDGITWELSGDLAALIVAADAKPAPHDDDLFGFVDSQASNVLKNHSWENVKAALKGYFDSLYGALASANTWTNVNNISGVTLMQTVTTRSSAGSTFAGVLHRRSRDASGSPAAINNNDYIGGFNARGYDGSNYATAGRAVFAMVAGQNWSGGNHGTYITLETTALNSTTRSEGMRVGPSGQMYYPGIGTTANAANAHIATGSSPANQLLISTSSARYKRDIEPLEAERADAVLELDGVWYRSTAEADDPNHSWYGLIAEDVAAIDPRLAIWGYFEDDWEYELVIEGEPETNDYDERLVRKLKAGAEKKPVAVAYDRFTVMLLDVAKREKASRIALSDELASLRARVEELETKAGT